MIVILSLSFNAISSRLTDQSSSHKGGKLEEVQ